MGCNKRSDVEDFLRTEATLPDNEYFNHPGLRHVERDDCAECTNLMRDIAIVRKQERDKVERLTGKTISLHN